MASSWLRVVLIAVLMACVVWAAFRRPRPRMLLAGSVLLTVEQLLTLLWVQTHDDIRRSADSLYTSIRPFVMVGGISARVVGTVLLLVGLYRYLRLRR